MHNAVYRNIENITKSNNDLMHEGLFYLEVKDNQLLKSYLIDYYDHINSLFDEICDVVSTKGSIETDKLLSDLENINDNFVDISRKYVGELISLIKKDSCL
ncbi:hypothetical protein M0D70_08155 [Acinetobacter portensis]|uniref:Uncharacterized protein n=3 Tax=Acinetobacter TaxID=469 RepID=A0ABU5GL22_9GAMM|nr:MULTISPECIES: hypothetical protein [Acinetobacter]MCK7609372.1 hypothetical protein [Acinetobacter portensis]MCK7640137.1 hypothetical protein [Acinetobacter portensis]MDY6462281.1 hypothetical protein [Acinetobacter faecalis]MDY6550933.1 hypothetical protein [Acinetobacter faecalis]UPO23138.1 hypothetical protein MZO21_11935 [Acinetobacter portensis]